MGTAWGVRKKVNRPAHKARTTIKRKTREAIRGFLHYNPDLIGLQSHLFSGAIWEAAMKLRYLCLQVASALILSTAVSGSAGDEGNLQTSDSETTPQEVFAAYSTAVRKEQWKEAYAMMTPAYRDFQAFELAFGLGMVGKDELIEKHQDPEKLKRLEIKAKQQHEEALALAEVGKELSDKERVERQQEGRRDFLKTLKDQEKFYCAAMAAVADLLSDDLPDGKLRNVTNKGDRARGTTTQYIKSIEKKNGKETKRREAYQSPVYFQKHGNQWLLDVPTAEETRRDVDQLEAGEE